MKLVLLHAVKDLSKFNSIFQVGFIQVVITKLCVTINTSSLWK